MPLPLLLIIGFISCFCFGLHWQRCGKAFTTLSLVLITLLGLQPVSDTLLAPAEKQFNKRYELITENPPQDVRYIVVLGGGLHITLIESKFQSVE